MDRWRIRALRDPEEKREAAQTVLPALPEWFGLPDSTAAYIRDCGSLPVWAAAEAGTVAGFIALKRTSDYAGEVFVMGVLPQNHRRGLGRALLQTLEARARQEHMLFLQVKTVAPGRYEAYDQTRLFYEAMGFYPLEVFPTLWDPWNPCLVMVKRLAEVET